MGFTYSSVVDAELDEVFAWHAWHARPGAITRLSPGPRLTVTG
jgi:ligand-binding SRPBCC domain-containing protein